MLWNKNGPSIDELFIYLIIFVLTIIYLRGYNTKRTFSIFIKFELYIVSYSDLDAESIVVINFGLNAFLP